MGEASRPLKLPAYEGILKHNRLHIEARSGLWIGPDNLRNPASLKWVLEAIQHPLFGVDHYPTLADKAAVLAWTIIRKHVFHDGCKRTGMSALAAFLGENGYELDATSDEIVEIALKVADSSAGQQYDFAEFAQWVARKMVPAG